MSIVQEIRSSAKVVHTYFDEYVTTEKYDVIIVSLLVRFDPNPIVYPTFFFVPLFLIAIPILDTSTVVISRIARGVSPFKGGRDHLSHRLMRLGISKVNSVLLLWGFTLIYGVFALILSNAPYSQEPLVVVIGSTIWLLALIIFLRIPAAVGLALTY